jgi:hypothetical protein
MSVHGRIKKRIIDAMIAAVHLAESMPRECVPLRCLDDASLIKRRGFVESGQYFNRRISSGDLTLPGFPCAHGPELP